MHKLKHEFRNLVRDELVTITQDSGDPDVFRFEYVYKDENYGTDLPNRVVMERKTALLKLEADFTKELDDITEMIKEIEKVEA